jgi:hypothetical protein
MISLSHFHLSLSFGLSFKLRVRPSYNTVLWVTEQPYDCINKSGRSVFDVIFNWILVKKIWCGPIYHIYIYITDSEIVNDYIEFFWYGSSPVAKTIGFMHNDSMNNEEQHFRLLDINILCAITESTEGNSIKKILWTVLSGLNLRERSKF